MIPLDRPVVVTGTPRSGKSLVAKILGASPEFAFASEPLMIWDMGMGPHTHDRRTADEVTEPVRERIRRACRNHVVSSGGQRYLDDLAYHALRTPFLHEVMPETKIIHTVRRGEDALPELLFGWTYRDTVAKALVRRRRNIRLSTLPRLAVQFARNYFRSRFRGRRATWGPRVPGLAEFAASHSPAEVAAFQWRSMVEIASADLQKLPRDQVLEVRLDELTRNPRTEMEQIAAFCEVQDPERIAKIATEIVDPHHEYENKVQLTPEEWRAVRPIINPLQQRLGYPAVRQESPPS